jgi:small conductance mechanosensitive channel
MDIETQLDGLVEFVAAYGLSVIGGILILIVGWIVANWASGATKRALAKSERVDATLRGFLSGLVKYAVLTVVIIAVLNQFGVQTASLIAVFGAAGLAIGLALQGTLSNVAAGVMLLLFRPFRVGQYVEAGGHAGTVKELSLFTTELATPDNVQIIIPNSAIWGHSVVNYSHHPTRRVDFTLGIGYADDIERAIATVREVIQGDSRSLSDPEPQIVVGNLGDSSVDLIVRVWVQAENYWPLKFDFTRAFKEAFDSNGISIPFPQRDIHVVQGAPIEQGQAAAAG